MSDASQSGTQRAPGRKKGDRSRSKAKRAAYVRRPRAITKANHGREVAAGLILGQSYVQIAESLGLSPATVASYARRKECVEMLSQLADENAGRIATGYALALETITADLVHADPDIRQAARDQLLAYIEASDKANSRQFAREHGSVTGGSADGGYSFEDILIAVRRGTTNG